MSKLLGTQPAGQKGQEGGAKELSVKRPQAAEMQATEVPVHGKARQVHMTSPMHAAPALHSQGVAALPVLAAGYAARV